MYQEKNRHTIYGKEYEKSRKYGVFGVYRVKKIKKLPLVFFSEMGYYSHISGEKWWKVVPNGIAGGTLSRRQV
mgnify:CR=1 FL=1